MRCFVSAAAGAAARSGSGLSLTHWQMWPGVCAAPAAPAACCFVLLAVLLCFIRTDVDVVKGTAEGFPSGSESDDSDSKVFPGSILFCTRVLLREIQKNPSPVFPFRSSAFPAPQPPGS